MTALFGALAGALAGVLTGFGVGGGSLLMIFMTTVAHIEQHMAQGINLFYFLPTASAALVTHCKEKQVCRRILLPAILAGLCSAAVGAFLAQLIDKDLMRKLFGVLLLYVGGRELFSK